jgi:hypothetical protein
MGGTPLGGTPLGGTPLNSNRKSNPSFKKMQYFDTIYAKNNSELCRIWRSHS